MTWYSSGNLYEPEDGGRQCKLELDLSIEENLQENGLLDDVQGDEEWCRAIASACDQFKLNECPEYYYEYKDDPRMPHQEYLYDSTDSTS